MEPEKRFCTAIVQKWTPIGGVHRFERRFLDIHLTFGWGFVWPDILGDFTKILGTSFTGT